jgi:hypothetical protein
MIGQSLPQIVFDTRSFFDVLKLTIVFLGRNLVGQMVFDKWQWAQSNENTFDYTE